jgi:Ca2+-binding RTX toxin-like protein
MTIWDSGGRDMLDGSGNTQAVTLDLRTGMDKTSLVGNDVYWIAEGAAIENAFAGKGADTVYGSSAANQLYGAQGADILYGNEGNDTLIGGIALTDSSDGADILYGNAGNDVIYGNAGNDTIYGGSQRNDGSETGNDVIYDGNGSDIIYGNGGTDTIVAGAGNDTYYGGAGDDTYLITWGNGADWLYPFEGADDTAGDILKIPTNINNTGIRTAADVIARATSDEEHTWIDLGSGNGVLLLFTEGVISEDDITVY